MRWAALLLSLFVIAGCGGDDEEQPAAPPAASSPEATTAAGTEVAMKDFSFAPRNITVTSGDEVTWVNEDASNHNVKFDDEAQEGIDNVREGEDGSVQFDEAGSFSYVCTYHPGMKGVVVVK